MKKILCIILSVVAMMSLFGCGKIITSPQRYVSKSFETFDTVTTVIAYDVSQKSFDEHMKLFDAELERYDKLFDIYNTYDGIANLAYINSNAAKKSVRVDSDISELLEFGKKVYDFSGGAVNICFGSVLSLWHEARDNAGENPDSAALPDMNALKKASKHTDINSLVVDSERGTVYFEDSELKLDVGAIAKGFAAEKIAEYLVNNNIWSDFALNLGGNVVTRGYKNGDGSSKWNIEIENPDQGSAEALETLSVSDLSVVTSGDYQRYFTVDGKNYCHIIDPKTLMPSEYFSGVTVLCKDSALADALSTALFILPLDEGKELVESTDGAEAVWADKSFNKTYSSGFENYLML